MDLISIELLKPYERNNRKHNSRQVELIANSIKEFGFNQPIVVDEDNCILVGHGRFFAAQRLELKSVPFLRVSGLTPEKKSTYRIIDNKLQNDSEWDYDNLESELQFIEGNGIDLAVWGLDDLKINDVIPVSQDDQSELDSKSPIICPECGHEFIPKK